MAQTDLNKAQAVLDEKQAELDVVQAMYDSAMKEKQVRLLKFIQIFFSLVEVPEAKKSLSVDHHHHQYPHHHNLQHHDDHQKHHY